MASVVPVEAWTAALVLDDGEDPRSSLYEIKDAATRADIPVRIVRTADEVDIQLESLSPDIVIVSGWYRMLPVKRFQPRTRFFGFHGSRLPAYRGNAPLVWQVLRGELEAGLSFFELVEGMDEGDLVGQVIFAIGPDDTIADVLASAETAAERLVLDHMHQLVHTEPELVPQTNIGASYCGLRIPEDGRIDWRWSSRQIHNFVRAQTRPYPGAFTALNGGARVAVWRTELDGRQYHAVPGSVVERTDGVLVVGTGDGVLRMVEADVETEAGPHPAVEVVRSLRARFT